MRRSSETPLSCEVREVREVGEWVRTQLYGLESLGRRRQATTAVAAAAAEQAYVLTDSLPEWRNETSELWRGHLQRVWESLSGDGSQHDALSRAVAEFLVSPLNHAEGQDGPDDFDRPQTVAAYYAANSALAGGVDCAETAVSQIFECIDLKYDADFPDARWREVQREIERIHDVVGLVVKACGPNGNGISRAVIVTIRA